MTGLCNTELPPGWAWARLGDLGVWYGGGTPSKNRPEFWTNGTIPWLSPKDMGKNEISSTQDHITESALNNSSAKLVPAGSVAVVVRSGILERIIPVTHVPFATTLNQDMKAIHPHKEITPHWIAWALRAFEREILRDCRKAGTTVASLSADALMNLKIPLAPLAEQHRIVEALEDHLSRLDTGARNAIRAKQLSCSLAISAAQSALDSCCSYPSMPLGSLIREPLRNGHSARATSNPDGIRTLTLTAVTLDNFSNKYTKITDADPDRVRNLWLEPGDILIQRSNTPELVGKPALYNGPTNWAIFPDLLIRVRTAKELTPEFAILALSSKRVRNYFKSHAKGLAGTMPKIDQATISNITIPVPPPHIQQDLVKAVRNQLDQLEHANTQLERVAKLGKSLREAILRSAFNGTLTSQDPSDEPVSGLLNRVRAARDPKKIPAFTHTPPRTAPISTSAAGIQEELPL